MPLSVVPVSVWVSLAVAAVLVYAWVRHRYYDSWQGLTFIVGGLVLVPAVAVSVSTLLAAVPATLALREYTHRSDVWAVCDSIMGAAFAPGAAGYVRWDGDPGSATVARLSSGTCAGLRNFAVSGRFSGASRDELLAVHVLAHEGEHLRGVVSEPEAECASMQRTGDMAVLLGMDPGRASALPDAYSTLFYARMPASYRSDACSPGGAMDLAPGGSFP